MAVVCGSGYRASIAASFLKREGYEDVTNVLGGMTAWKAAGLPTVNDRASRRPPAGASSTASSPPPSSRWRACWARGAVLVMRPILPYALAFAAGAMIYVVVEEVVPESQSGGHGDVATLGTMIGFAVMMTLDVVLG